MKYIQIASTKKRIISSLIDLSIIIGFTCLFYFSLFSKVVANIHHYDVLNEQIKTAHNESGLYIDNQIYTIKYPNATKDELEPKLRNFYTVYLNAKDEREFDLYWYFTHILNLADVNEKYKDEQLNVSQILEWKDNSYNEYKVKANVSEDDVNDFFRVSFASATSILDQYEPIRSANGTIVWGNIRAVMYASMLGTFIPCLIIPLWFKNGKTIGKLFTGLIVLTDDGYEYKKWKLIIRYLAFYIVEIFGGAITIGLSFIFTCTLTLFSQKHRALHDYIAFSVVADEPHSVYFKNQQEEEAYDLKHQEDSIA